jgi:tetratricopeptide (TPR) repeat protein
VSGGPPGAYPGNLSLPKEVREKIVSTFRHTLDLYKDGKLDDCLIGCDFILKMDPRFAPARQLQEKARNPKADINVEELRALLVADAGAAPSHPEAPGARITQDVPLIPPSRPGGGLEDLSLDSLSLDGPVSDFTASAPAGEFRLPFDPGASPFSLETPIPGLSQGPLAGDPELSFREPASAEEEIAALLVQGDEARARGDRQQAIEIWSRVFLSDIDNEEAAARIEETRQEMTDEGHRLATALEQGQESYARGDLEAARTQFDSILTLDEPTPPAAAPPPPRPVAPPPVPPAAVPVVPLPPHDLSAVSASSDVLAEEMDQSGPPGRRSWTAPAAPSFGAAVSADEAAAVEKRPGIALGGRLPLVAGGILVLVLAAGAYLFFLRSPAEKPPAAPAEAGPSLEHATALFREGKIAETADELGRIPRGHPDYAKAQKLLASLSGPAASAAGAAGANAPAPAVPAGETGIDPPAEKRYIDALKGFSLAAPHFPEDPSFSQQMAVASSKVSELTPAVKLYNDGEYETAIPMLWRIYQAGRDNQDARSYLLRSYFNQGITQLQNGLYEKAKESFGEVLALDGEDEEAARHHRFAERYRSGDLDLLGQIYVRYVSPRS